MKNKFAITLVAIGVLVGLYFAIRSRVKDNLPEFMTTK